MNITENNKKLSEFLEWWELSILTDIDYCEDRKHWYWEDYKNDTYRQGFESEEEARKDLEEYLADKTNKKI